MSESQNNIVVTSRVRLARNYYDLPFSNATHPDNATACVARAREAFAGDEPYAFHSLAEMDILQRMSLVEQHLISRDLMRNSNIGAALIRKDRAVSIMINEEDHLRIQAIQPGFHVEEAARLAFQVEEKLQERCHFSFDGRLGYLTACPTNTGTGMRASLMLHLPLLTYCKQMGHVGQSVAKLGLTIRGIYGEGSDALGDLYQVSNQVTLGRTEEEIMEGVIAVGRQLIEMEVKLRNRTTSDARLKLVDRVFRSYGLLRFARQMTTPEMMEHWSNLRLGAALELLPVDIATVDELLTTAQDAHARLYRAEHGQNITTDQARCEIIRSKLNPTPQEV